MAEKCCSSSQTKNLAKPCCHTQFEEMTTQVSEIDSCCSSEEKAINEEDECCGHTKDQETTACYSSEIEEAPSMLTNVHAERKEFRIYGMDCPSCALTIEKGLSGLKEVQEAKVNYSTAKLQVLGSFNQVEETVQKLGFTVEPLHQNEKLRTYLVEGMDCGSCAQSIENHLNNIPAVNSASVSFSTGKMKVEHENSVADIVSEISKIGYHASLLENNTDSKQAMKSKGEFGSITISGIFIVMGFIGTHTVLPPFLTTIFLCFGNRNQWI